MFLADATVLAQASFDSKASGAWNSAASWQLMSGTDADGIPDANDNATIKSGHVITTGNASRDCANLIVDAGGTLSINGTNNARINANPGSATINGIVIMSSTGILTENGTGTRTLIIGAGGKLTVSGTTNPSFDIYNFDLASTVEYMNAGNQNVISGIVYGNLTLGGGGTKTVAPLPADTSLTTNGKVTIDSGVTFDCSTNILRANFNGDVLINGTLDASVGIVIVVMKGATWTNNGVHRCSTTPGFGYQPTTTFQNTQITGTTTTQKFYDVVIDGTSNAMVSIDSARNINIAPGATLSNSAGVTHKLTGNWTNSGTYNCGSSTVSLIGATAQSITGSSFCNLVVNNPAGVTFTGNVNISSGGSLTMTSGNINTGTNTLAINSTDTAALALGSNKIFGTITRSIAPGSIGTYRFFSANAFVTPNGVNTPSTITATAFPSTNPPNLGPNADTNKTAKRYYTISASGAGSGFSYTMRLPYEQTEVRGTEANYVLWKNSGAGWSNTGSATVDITNNYVEKTGLSSFSNWAIAEASSALPIQLSYFNVAVAPNSNNVHLTWGTLTETNNFGFYVQQSTSNQSSFADVPNSFIAGHGTTLVPHNYDWVHQNVPAGTYYYRVRQIDLDGTVHFTDAIEVIVDVVSGINEQPVPVAFALSQNYPNPFNPSTKIQFTVENRGFTTLTVFNLIGERIVALYSDYAEPGQVYSLDFNASNLTNGVYFYKLVNNNKSSLKKMILLK